MGQQPLIAPPDRPGDRSTEIAAGLSWHTLLNLTRWHDDKARIAKSEKSERDERRHRALADRYWKAAEAIAKATGNVSE